MAQQQQQQQQRSFLTVPQQLQQQQRSFLKTVPQQQQPQRSFLKTVPPAPPAAAPNGNHRSSNGGVGTGTDGVDTLLGSSADEKTISEVDKERQQLRKVLFGTYHHNVSRIAHPSYSTPRTSTTNATGTTTTASTTNGGKSSSEDVAESAADEQEQKQPGKEMLPGPTSTTTATTTTASTTNGGTSSSEVVAESAAEQEQKQPGKEMLPGPESTSSLQWRKYPKYTRGIPADEKSDEPLPPLPKDFEPTLQSVIIEHGSATRSRALYNTKLHPGNKKLQEIVKLFLPQYRVALQHKARKLKTKIIDDIIAIMESHCPIVNAAFIRRGRKKKDRGKAKQNNGEDHEDDSNEELDERWYPLGLQDKREKVGYEFRSNEGLTTAYASGRYGKTERRRQIRLTNEKKREERRARKGRSEEGLFLSAKEEAAAAEGRRIIALIENERKFAALKKKNSPAPSHQERIKKIETAPSHQERIKKIETYLSSKPPSKPPPSPNKTLASIDSVIIGGEGLGGHHAPGNIQFHTTIMKENHLLYRRATSYLQQQEVITSIIEQHRRKCHVSPHSAFLHLNARTGLYTSAPTLRIRTYIQDFLNKQVIRNKLDYYRMIKNQEIFNQEKRKKNSTVVGVVGGETKKRKVNNNDYGNKKSQVSPSPPLLPNPLLIAAPPAVDKPRPLCPTTDTAATTTTACKAIEATMDSVVIASGLTGYHAPGNVKLRDMVKEYLPTYIKATPRESQTLINILIEQIRTKCHPKRDTAFLHMMAGKWYPMKDIKRIQQFIYDAFREEEQQLEEELQRRIRGCHNNLDKYKEEEERCHIYNKGQSSYIDADDSRRRASTLSNQTDPEVQTVVLPPMNATRPTMIQQYTRTTSTTSTNHPDMVESTPLPHQSFSDSVVLGVSAGSSSSSSTVAGYGPPRPIQHQSSTFSSSSSSKKKKSIDTVSKRFEPKYENSRELFSNTLHKSDSFSSVETLKVVPAREELGIVGYDDYAQDDEHWTPPLTTDEPPDAVKSTPIEGDSIDPPGSVKSAPIEGDSTGQPLPVDLEPAPYSVIIELGHEAGHDDAPGNQALHELAKSILPFYIKGTTDLERQQIVSLLVDKVEEACPPGTAFLQLLGGRYCSVNSFLAHCKVSEVIQQLLSEELVKVDLESPVDGESVAEFSPNNYNTDARLSIKPAPTMEYNSGSSAGPSVKNNDVANEEFMNPAPTMEHNSGSSAGPSAKDNDVANKESVNPAPLMEYNCGSSAGKIAKNDDVANEESVNPTPTMEYDCDSSSGSSAKNDDGANPPPTVEHITRFYGGPTVNHAYDRTCSTPFPLDFKPSMHCVMFGNTKRLLRHPGNKRLREIAKTFLPQYIVANSNKQRLVKKNILTKVITMIQEDCPPGAAFVRLSEGRWWPVRMLVVRDRMGQVFRDLLSDKYRSSIKSKVAMRRAKREAMKGTKPGQQEPARPDGYAAAVTPSHLHTSDSYKAAAASMLNAIRKTSNDMYLAVQRSVLGSAESPQMSRMDVNRRLNPMIEVERVLPLTVTLQPISTRPCSDIVRGGEFRTHDHGC